MFVSQPVVSPPLVLEQAGGLWYEFFELNLNNAAPVWGAEAILVGAWGGGYAVYINILPSFSLFSQWIKNILHVNDFTQQLGKEQETRLCEQLYAEMLHNVEWMGGDVIHPG